MLFRSPSRVRACAGSPSRPRPSKRTVPVSLASVPHRQLTSVLLPEPFGPMRPRRSPALTVSEIPSSATKPPKRLPRLSMVRSAFAASVAFAAVVVNYLMA